MEITACTFINLFRFPRKTNKHIEIPKYLALILPKLTHIKMKPRIYGATRILGHFFYLHDINENLKTRFCQITTHLHTLANAHKRTHIYRQGQMHMLAMEKYPFFPLQDLSFHDNVTVAKRKVCGISFFHFKGILHVQIRPGKH